MDSKPVNTHNLGVFIPVQPRVVANLSVGSRHSCLTYPPLPPYTLTHIRRFLILLKTRWRTTKSSYAKKGIKKV